jgi:hypothetical protein
MLGSARALCGLGYVEARVGQVDSAHAILEKLAGLSGKQHVALSGMARICGSLLIFASLDPSWALFRGKLAGF